MGRRAIHQHQLVVFLGAQHHHPFARFKLLDGQIVGDYIEGLLGFALPIILTHSTQRTIEPGGTQLGGNALGGARNRRHYPGQKTHRIVARSTLKGEQTAVQGGRLRVGAELDNDGSRHGQGGIDSRCDGLYLHGVEWWPCKIKSP